MIAVPLQPEWRTATATFCTPFARVQKYRTKLYLCIKSIRIFEFQPTVCLGHVTVIVAVTVGMGNGRKKERKKANTEGAGVLKKHKLPIEWF